MKSKWEVATRESKEQGFMKVCLKSGEVGMSQTKKREFKKQMEQIERAKS